MRCLPVILISMILPALLLSQDDQPSIKPVRVEQPPRIDGFLDEPLWRDIDPLTDFRQFDPDWGEPATETTEVRICYDSRFLYIGVRAADRDPGKLVTTVFERDGNLCQGESFIVFIDSLLDRRTAFMFESNPLGTQEDAQLSEGQAFNLSWDAIWYSKANIDAQGYTLEMAIPFFVLRFKPAEVVDMGILFRRLIRRKNEVVYWPVLGRDYTFYNMSQYATLKGMTGIERGVDVELKPYVIAGYSKSPEESEYKADAGLDLKWGVTSNLTADFTLNTDFAQVESDALKINLTRFSLFYPEKRDFFLESADLFHFGLQETAHVFFSRRIGIRGDREVPILGGARLHGLVGNTNIGLLAVRTREADGIAGENFAVARIKQNVFGRSYVGGIFTNRTGNDPEQDRTVGADCVLLHGPDAGFFGAAARSDRTGTADGNWFRTLAYFNNTDLHELLIHYLDIGPRFDPGIGFIQRRDQRTISLHGGYKPRPGWAGVRQLKFLGDYTRTYNYGGDVESVYAAGQFDVNFQTDDIASVLCHWQEELVPFDFELAPGVVVPAGRYSFFQAWPGISLSAARRVSAFGGFAHGGFYGGRLTVGGVGWRIKITPRLQIGGEVEVNDVDLPGGGFVSNISRLDLSYYFSPSLTTRLAAQYSSLFEDFLLNLRVRWLYAPGSEVWLVYDEGRRFDLPGASLRDRALVFKIVHNFNF
jgi:hypothetical protein